MPIGPHNKHSGISALRSCHELLAECATLVGETTPTSADVMGLEVLYEIVTARNAIGMLLLVNRYDFSEGCLLQNRDGIVNGARSGLTSIPGHHDMV